MRSPQKTAVGRCARPRWVDAFALLLAATLSGVLPPTDARADGPPSPETAARRIDGCPLEIGRLRARTWVESDARSLSIRFAPVSRDLARCLSLPSLALVGPTGHRVEGRQRRRLNLPVMVGRSHSVPAKVAPGESTRDLGAAVRIRFPLGDRRPAPIEFHFDLADAPGGDRLLRDGIAAGWEWRGIARDVCAETRVPIWIAVGELDTCEGAALDQ